MSLDREPSQDRRRAMRRPTRRRIEHGVSSAGEWRTPWLGKQVDRARDEIRTAIRATGCTQASIRVQANVSGGQPAASLRGADHCTIRTAGRLASTLPTDLRGGEGRRIRHLETVVRISLSTMRRLGFGVESLETLAEIPAMSRPGGTCKPEPIGLPPREVAGVAPAPPRGEPLRADRPLGARTPCQ